MPKKIQEYNGKEIIVRYDPTICIHAGECVRGLPRVFDIKLKAWIQPDNAKKDEIVRTIQKCPSGALTFELK